MAREEQASVLMEDVQIIFKNFTGKEGRYNDKGDRNFCVILDEKTAKQMEKDGWNVKRLKPREEDLDEDGSIPEGTPYIQVKMNFDNRPPRVVMITSTGKTQLGKEQVEILDAMEFKMVDLTVNAYSWSVAGKSGIKPYLRTMYVTIEEDDLDRKYADVGMDEGR